MFPAEPTAATSTLRTLPPARGAFHGSGLPWGIGASMGSPDLHRVTRRESNHLNLSSREGSSCTVSGRAPARESGPPIPPGLAYNRTAVCQRRLRSSVVRRFETACAQVRSPAPAHAPGERLSWTTKECHGGNGLDRGTCCHCVGLQADKEPRQQRKSPVCCLPRAVARICGSAAKQDQAMPRHLTSETRLRCRWLVCHLLGRH
jgi:hypothetical protein